MHGKNGINEHVVIFCAIHIFKFGLNMGLSGPVDHTFNLCHSYKCVNCICICMYNVQYILF